MTAINILTNRLRLVPPSQAHQNYFLAFYASPRAAVQGWTRVGAQAVAFWDFICDHWSRRGFGWFVIEEAEGGAPIGMCGPWEDEHMPEGELAWSLWYDRVEGKGVAYEAASAARLFAYRDLGWTTAVSYIAYGNLRSIALARRLGAKLDGDWMTPNGNQVPVYRPPAPEALA